MWEDLDQIGHWSEFGQDPLKGVVRAFHHKWRKIRKWWIRYELDV